MSVWVNIDITEKLYTIHSDGCAYIHELETERKGIEELELMEDGLTTIPCLKLRLFTLSNSPQNTSFGTVLIANSPVRLMCRDAQTGT
jgi:hypothetical protein